jgi:hypothetical protein
MSLPLDPIRFARRRAVATWLVVAPALVLCAIWAGWPIEIPAVMPPAISPSRTSEHQVPSVAPLDIASFDAPLWVIPPSPVATAAEPAPPPPEPVTKLQLVGIVRERHEGVETLRAALYDPGSDRIVLVADGEKVGTQTVRAVTDSAVELTNGRSISKLVLDERAKAQAKKGGRS